MRLEDVTEADLVRHGLIDPDVKHPIMSNFREVPTPQTPACEHQWHNDWGSFGPIMVCTKCGEWHHD